MSQILIDNQLIRALGCYLHRISARLDLPEANYTFDLVYLHCVTYQRGYFTDSNFQDFEKRRERRSECK